MIHHPRARFPPVFLPLLTEISDHERLNGTQPGGNGVAELPTEIGMALTDAKRGPRIDPTRQSPNPETDPAGIARFRIRFLRPWPEHRPKHRTDARILPGPMRGMPAIPRADRRWRSKTAGPDPEIVSGNGSGKRDSPRKIVVWCEPGGRTVYGKNRFQGRGTV
jgi:hypothetical protein